MKLLLILAAITAASTASLLDHHAPSAAVSSKQQRQLLNPQLLLKKQLSEAAGTEETELKQLAKRWGSRFSKTRSRGSHGVSANERRARDYVDFDRGQDLDFGDFTDTADVEYLQTRDTDSQQQHILASRDYGFLLGQYPVQQQKKREHQLVSRDYGTLFGQYPVKQKQQKQQKREHQLVSRDYGTLFGSYPVKKQQLKKRHELASRDYFGILGSTVEQSSIEQKSKRASAAAPSAIERKAAPEERDYMGMIDDGGLKREEMERASRDYLDVILGGGYGQTYSNDPYEQFPYGK